MITHTLITIFSISYLLVEAYFYSKFQTKLTFSHNFFSNKNLLEK